MEIKTVTYHHIFGDVNGVHIDDMYDAYKKSIQMKYMKENNVDYIYSQDYDISYLKDINSIKYLHLNEEVENIDTLYLLPNLNGLVISSKYLASIDFNKLPQLEKIVIGHKNKEIINLGNNIKEITISSYDFHDLTKINANPLLEKLYISYGPKLKSLAGIENFPNLKEVTIDGCFRLHNISSLCACKNIIKLNIYDCNKIEDLYDSISKLDNLEEINLYNKATWVVNSMKDLSFLDNLNKLKYLKTDYKVSKKGSIHYKKIIKI